MERRFQESRDAGRRASLYEPGGGVRPLRVVFDEDSLQALRGSEALQLLRGLTSLDDVERWSYSASGPPPGTKHVGEGAWSAPVGWLVVEEVSSADRGFASHGVAYATGDTVTQTAIVGDMGRGDLATWDAIYAHLAADEAAAARRLDSIASGAADAAHADLLITTRPFLLTGKWFGDRGTVACDPTDGVALTGQFLRSRGVYMGWHEESRWRVVLGRGLYHWVGARALLPEGWRWFSHCTYSDPEAETDLTCLAQSVFQRVGRILRRLDDVRWAMTLPPGNDVADDAVTSLDYILIDLVGAFDAAARVAHRALGLEQSEFVAQWRGRRDWAAALRREAPSLAALVAPATAGADLLEILGYLRNTVHGANLQPTRFSGTRRRDERIAVALPRRDAEAIAVILERRGWGEDTGLTRFGHDRTFVAPDRLATHLIRHSLPLLNSLMAATPVERLGGQPPAEREDFDPHSPFAPKHQRGVLLQFGLGDIGMQGG